MRLGFRGNWILSFLAVNLVMCSYVYRRELTGWYSKPGTSKEGSSVVLGGVVEFPVRYVTSSDPLELQFRVENPLPETVTFSEVKPSCSCSDARLKEKVIGPGDSTWLTMSVKTAISKMDVKRVSVELLDDKSRKWVYKTTIKTYPIVVVGNGESQIEFGEVSSAGWEKSVSVCTHRPPGNSSYHVTVLGCRDPIDTVLSSAGEAENADGVLAETFELRIRGLPQQSGTHSSEVVLGLNDGAREHRVPLMLRWSISGPYVVEPSALRFGSLADRSTLRVRRTDGGEFQVTSVKSEEDTVVARWDCGGGEAIEVTIDAILDRDRLSQGFYKRLIVHTNDPAFPTFSVWMSGFPKQAP